MTPAGEERDPDEEAEQQRRAGRREGEHGPVRGELHRFRVPPAHDTWTPGFRSAVAPARPPRPGGVTRTAGSPARRGHPHGGVTRTAPAPTSRTCLRSSRRSAVPGPTTQTCPSSRVPGSHAGAGPERHTVFLTRSRKGGCVGAMSSTTAGTLEERLRSVGLRVTAPRVAVLRELEHHAHADVDTLVGAVRERHHAVSHAGRLRRAARPDHPRPDPPDRAAGLPRPVREPGRRQPPPRRLPRRAAPSPTSTASSARRPACSRATHTVSRWTRQKSCSGVCAPHAEPTRTPLSHATPKEKR